jgi:hypothetical protein
MPGELGPPHRDANPVIASRQRADDVAPEKTGATSKTVTRVSKCEVMRWSWPSKSVYRRYFGGFALRHQHFAVQRI